MPGGETLAVFALAALVLAATPGLSILYVMSRSLAQGTAAGILSAAGLATGGAVHAVAAAAGLSALLAHSPLAFTIVKLAGGAYLVWLGVRLLRPLDRPLAPTGRGARPSLPRIYGQGVLIEALNPKVALFFLAFLPQFVDPAAGAAGSQMLILGLIVPLLSLPVDILVAVTSGAAAQRLAAWPVLTRLQRRLSGTILIALGLRVALGERT